MSADAWLEVTVEEVDRKIGDTVALSLAAKEGHVLPNFDAGAHVDVRISPGLTRQYSLCGDPAETGKYRLGVLRDENSRGGSAAMNERIVAGDQLVISEPKNHFPLLDAQHTILVGGGIGITPLIAMAHQLHSKGRSFDLHYCVSNAEKAAFQEDLTASPFSEKVATYYSRGGELPSFVPSEHLRKASGNTHIYVCGPTGFMDWVFDEARALGYPPNALHKEDFGADVDLSGGSFTVIAKETGVTVTVAEGQRIVDALTEAGIDIEVSCEEGVCGTCLCDVVEGEPDHRDSFLTEEERDSNELIMVCCSRAKSPTLVLDI